MHKEKLFLFTEFYPFAQGEDSFLEQEVYILRNRFNLTIVSGCSKGLYDEKRKNVLPSDVNVIWLKTDTVNGLELIKYVPDLIFDRVFWREVGSIVKKRILGFKIFKELLYYRANVLKFKRAILASGIISENGIYYSFWYNYMACALGDISTSNSGICTVVRAHGYDLYEERTQCGWQFYKRYYDCIFDKLLFISQNGREYYLDRFTEKSSEIGKYENSYLGTLRQFDLMSRKESKDEFLIFSCSDVIEVKRIDRIIDALSLIKDISIKWLHAGDGRLFDEVKDYAFEKLNQLENITYEFVGRLPNKEIQRILAYNSPDCFLMTSESEGSPVSMQEAISYGIPVVGPNVGGIKELIDDNGVLLKSVPTNEEIANAIVEVLNADPQKKKRMSDKSVSIWEEKFNACNNAIRLSNIIEETRKRKYVRGT